MKTIVKYIFAAILSISVIACSDDFFDIENNGVVTDDDLTDLAAKNPDAILQIVQPLQVGIYSYMIQYNTQGSSSSQHADFGWLGIGHLGDVMNDDLALHTQGNGWFTFDYQLDYWGEQYVRPFFYWNFCYTLIARANDIIAKIDPETPSADLKAILGQSLAIRALGHAYAAQMFQQTYIGNEDAPGVPILLTSAEEGTNLGRAPLRDVYAQVEKDFKAAVTILEGWQRPNKVYIDKQVAAGLYARICLVTNNWDDAITYARIAQQGYSVFTTTELLADGFNNINSKEWIWGGDITGETTTMFASFFSFVCSFEAGYGGAVGCYRKMDKKLYDAMSATDVRRQQFKVGNNVPDASNFPDYTNVKFKKVDGWLADYVFMRVSEMILTEAEALARKGQETEAATVLRALMTNRDPSWNKNTVTGEEVYQQRRVELWAEGFSLFDHLRLKKGIDRSYAGSNHYAPVQYKISAGSWYFLYQIPLRELQNNSNIDPSEQNPAPTGTKFEQ
ncbi:MAG: RagB/SusD family nutrient uptake outer membrane protein [Prevotellaceae bacterium]|jgi:hypothetical protein|nr:RagB/SusD family nutrient uptake outer membrane protein [Prevotellaceae bacterium]